jgi:hypothetical protein
MIVTGLICPRSIGIGKRLSSDLSTYFSKQPVGSWEKIVGVVKRALIGMVVFFGTVFGNLATLGIPTLIAHHSEGKREKIKNEIEGKRIEHLQSSMPESWSAQRKEDALFIQQANVLKSEIGALNPSQPILGSLEEIYHRFQKLAGDPQFIQDFERLFAERHPAAIWVQELAGKFRSADVSNLLEQYSRERLGVVSTDLSNGYSIGKVEEALREERKRFAFKHNFFWAISHPSAWYHSLESKLLHKEYNSHESNPTYCIDQATYQRKDGKAVAVHWIAGPTPMNDPVYEKIFLKGAHEFRSNVMDTTKPHEKVWIEQMSKTAANSNGHLEHLVWGFATKDKKGYLEPKDLDTLLDRYQEAIEGEGSGVIIPETALTKEQRASAFKQTKELLKELNPDLSTKSARHAVLMMVDTMMTLGALIQYLERVQDVTDVHIATACKQCFDRGPVYTAALQLFFRSLRGDQPLKAEEFYRLAGLPLFRAPLNEGREQLKAKFAVYESFSQIIGSRFDVLAKHARNFSQSIFRTHQREE